MSRLKLILIAAFSTSLIFIFNNCAGGFNSGKSSALSITGSSANTGAGSPSSPQSGGSSAPTQGIYWVYHNGTFNWGGDWSFGGLTINYMDTSGVPIEGPYDISATENGQWAGWLPYISGNCKSTDLAACFDTTPYKYLIFSAEVTVANQVFAAAILSAGDTPDGNNIYDLGQYCSGGDNPTVGQWESCKVPLSAFQPTDSYILKFSIQDETGLKINKWYLDDVGFSSN